MTDVSRGALAQSIWDAITTAYGQKATTNVQVPVEDVLFALCGVAANLIAQRPTNYHEKLIRIMPEQTARLVTAVRQKRSGLDLHYNPTRFVLPN